MTPCGKPTPRGSCPLPESHSGRCLDLPSTPEGVFFVTNEGEANTPSVLQSIAPASMACTFPGCGNRPRRASGGLCRGHDAQRLKARRTNQPLTPIAPHTPGRVAIGVRVTDSTAQALDELGPTRGRAAKKVLEAWSREREWG